MANSKIWPHTHDIELKNIQEQEVKHRKQINALIAEAEQDDALIGQLEKKSDIDRKERFAARSEQEKQRRK